jgi:manganese transport protein
MTERPPSPPHEPGQSEIPHGLPVVSASDPEALAREEKHLAELAGKPLVARWAGYARMTGPGWLQSAMTLGGGSAASSLTIGAFFGYRLLWVQPLAMILGVLMLSALSYQTLSTGARPFGAMKRYVTPAVAWAWAVATLLATVIWHFPQYALAAGMTEDMIVTATGWSPAAGSAARTAFLLGVGAAVLILSITITWSYGSGWRGIRLYERALKLMVWMIILAFGVVVVRTTFSGRLNWLDVLKGFIPNIPDHPKAPEQIMGAFGAAVGINMTFLFPYTLLARGWGKAHRGLARFDLLTGMLIPFSLATGLMVLAAGCTIYGRELGEGVKPVDAAGMIAEAGVGPFFGHIIFGLGILGMVLSTITTHMLVSGFAACEMFGIEPRGWKYKLACLIPAPGVLGVVLWKYMGFWIAVRTSAICGILLPIAYVAFLILHNRRAYLGEDTPAGWKRWAWNLGMLLAIAATVASIAYYLASNWQNLFTLKA